jgi:hypothetical protein
MKTNLRITLLAVISSLVLIGPMQIQAQNCTYNLDNSLTCGITVTVRWFDNTTPGCSFLCDTQTGITVGALNTRQVTCTNCSGVCNVEVTVTAPFTSAAVDINSTTHKWWLLNHLRRDWAVCYPVELKQYGHTPKLKNQTKKEVDL